MRILKKLIIPIIVVCAAIIFIVCANAPKEIKTLRVSEGNVEATLELTGNVYGNEEETVCAQASGIIIWGDYKIGDPFQKGNTLVSYEISDLERNAATADINVEYYENGYRSAIQENEKNKAKYNEAVIKDANYQAQYDETMDSINALDLSQYTQNNEISNNNDSIQKEILDINSQISEKTNELSKLNIKITLATFQQKGWDMQFLTNEAQQLQDEIFGLNAKLFELKEELLELPKPQMENEEYKTYLELTKKITDINRDWATVKNDKISAEAKILDENAILQLQSLLSIAQVEACGAREDFEKATEGIIADCNGVITEKYVKSGSYVAKGTPIYSYQATDKYKVVLEVSKYDIETVEIGQKTDITVGSKVYEGTVDKVSYVAVTDSSDNSKVKIEVVLKAAKDMIIGIEADAIIHIGKADNIPVLPNKALYSDEDGNYCYVVENGVIRKQYITIGLRGKNGVQVVEGIAVDSHVVIDAITDARVGEKVNEKIN